MSARTAAACALAAAILLAACGSSGQGMSDAARRRLTPLVEQVRERAAAHDAAGAEQTLATLRQTVAQFEQQGAISRADAEAIMHAAGAVESKLALITTTTTTTTAPLSDEEQDHTDKHGHHRKDENGNQNG
jgi:hypothetical protein